MACFSFPILGSRNYISPIQEFRNENSSILDSRNDISPILDSIIDLSSIQDWVLEHRGCVEGEELQLCMVSKYTRRFDGCYTTHDTTCL